METSAKITSILADLEDAGMAPLAWMNTAIIHAFVHQTTQVCF